MKKCTMGLVMLLISGMGFSFLWDSNIHKVHQIEKYQKEMVERDDKIRGLEDSIVKLNGRIEFDKAAWDYLRGIDSITIDGVIYWVRELYEYEEHNYHDVPVSLDYKLIVS